MLTYFLPGYNNYKIRTNQIPSGSTFLRVCTQNMLTLEDYCFLLNPGQWSYDSCESTVDISFNLDIALDVNVGDEYRLYLTPAITNSVTPFTYLDDIWHGSLQVFYSQSVNKPAYVNQIPLEDVFISEDTANTFVYWSQTQPPGPTTTTTTGAPTTTTTAAPTTTTTSTTSTTTTTTSTTTTSTTTTTTTAAPVTLNSELFIGNLLGVSGNNVCISGSTDGVIDSTIIYELKTFLSSDAGCTTPYGTSWDLLNLPNIYNYNGQVQRSTTSGGQIDNANYYRNRVSGSFAFQYQPGNLMSPTFTFDISGSGYQDFTHAGLTYRINAAGCKLNNSVDCTEALEIEYLVVAGGGGGGTANGGVNGAGGGAGGWQTGSAIIADNSAMTVTVGTGGAGAIYFTTEAQNGTNSSFNSLTSTGGGKGGSGNGLGTGAGGNGGSGGGEAASGAGIGTGIAGQGFNGSAGDAIAPVTFGGNGGGAAGIGTTTVPGDAKLWLDGNYYAAGGKGYNRAGGIGEGTKGSGGNGANLTNGTNGQDGIVIIRYAGTTTKATGGTITTAGGYTYHTFTTSGTFQKTI